MKKMLMTSVAVLAFAAVASAMSLSEAGTKLSEAAENPATMASVMKELSAENQVKFLKSVNAAINAMPVSEDEKTSYFAAANKAALKNAAEGNVKALLSETFATASLKSLTAINEQFAAELFNRNADAAHPVTDEDMYRNATNVLAFVKERNSQSDVSNADERNALVALMFIRASEGSPDGLRKDLTDSLGNEDAGEWIAAALGDGEPKTYEPILGLEDAESRTEVAAILPTPLMQGPGDTTTAFLGDLASPITDAGKQTTTYTDTFMDPTQFALPDSMIDSGLGRIPRSLNQENKYYNGYTRGESATEPMPYP